MALKVNKNFLNCLYSKLSRNLNIGITTTKYHSSATAGRGSKENQAPIAIRTLKETDRDYLVEFLRKHHFTTIGSEPKVYDPLAEFNNAFLSTIEEGTSLLAIRKKKFKEEILGAVIAAPKDFESLLSVLEYTTELPMSSKWGTVVHLSACIEKEIDVFELFGAERVLQVHALSVHRDAQDLALDARLLQELAKLAKTKEYELLTVDCTSYKLAQLCEKLSMKSMNKIWYDEYFDERGRQIIYPPSPNCSIRTFAMELKE